MTVKLRKIAAPFLMTLLCGAILHGQSLYELAQKEKARRAKLKGKTSRVITNADLRMSEKTASNTTTSTQPAPTKNPQKASPPSESSNPRAVQARSDREEEQRETAAAGQRAGQRNLAATNPPQKRRDTSGSRARQTARISCAYW